MRVAALVVAAGRGERLGHELPKAFVPLAGRPLLLHALEALAAAPSIDCIVPVVAPADRERWRALESAWRRIRGLAPAVDGGVERQDSVHLGLAALAADVAWVAVHDAARPLVRPEVVERVVGAARAEGAAILALPVRDTIKRVAAGGILETPSRSELWAAQTPQVFRTALLREALAKARAEGFRATDDAQLVERLGVRVRVVEGDPTNLKITDPADLEAAEGLLARRAGAGGGRMRIGHGFDAHRLLAGRPLVLGGVEIPFERGLEGHSDGDVLIHAAASALLGALGRGGLGRQFPSSDPALEGIASGRILARVGAQLGEAGLALAHLDTTLVAQAPRLEPWLPKMAETLAGILGVDPGRVNVKVTSSDGLGFTGRGEGMAAFAVALLEPAAAGAGR